MYKIFIAELYSDIKRINKSRYRVQNTMRKSSWVFKDTPFAFFATCKRRRRIMIEKTWDMSPANRNMFIDMVNVAN